MQNIHHEEYANPVCCYCISHISWTYVTLRSHEVRSTCQSNLVLASNAGWVTDNELTMIQENSGDALILMHVMQLVLLYEGPPCEEDEN